ncbi:MAG: thiamine pyrophosphate-binding protein, partial [Acidothermales bacterium]|nr:thiamine pyrophosphate-binding protein [Acidothermales bacterium]
DAYWAMSPVISLTTSIRGDTRDRYEYQEVDQLPMHASVTRFARTVHRPDRAVSLLRHAIRAATSSPPGPTHLEVPADIMQAPLDADGVYREPEFGVVPGLRSAPPRETAGRIVDAILEAERPIVLAGNGVLLSGAAEELTELAEALSLPVVTSNGGKGSIREDHDLSVGLIGRYSRKVANEVATEADLVLVVGSRLGGMATDSYKVPSPGARILHVDVDPTVLGTTYREEISAVGDAKLTLIELIEEVDRRGARTERTAWAQQVARRVAAWMETVEEEIAKSGNPIHPAAVMRALRAALRPTDIVAADTGFMGAWAGALFPVTAPGRNYIRAAGSLGWAFPAALGAQVAAPDRHVVAVIGDGGIGYHLSEFETAVRRGIPVVAMVLNNRSLAFEYHSQRDLWDGHILPHMNDYEDVDYAQVASDMGAHGKRVTDPDDLSPSIAAALESGRPALLDVIVDKEKAAPVTNFERVHARVV